MRLAVLFSGHYALFGRDSPRPRALRPPSPDHPVQSGPVLLYFHMEETRLLKKFPDRRSLGFPDLHGHEASRFYLGNPQLGDGPVKHQAVLPAVQGQGGLEATKSRLPWGKEAAKAGESTSPFRAVARPWPYRRRFS